ncbi:hypothetical protein [Rubripirellula lacrimiformis]|uniref:hypothetical protein n=1 Tax=Rubripirellula lacrimiformis TaxID=1930273 RepID=UPI001C54EDC3|nr:hypothetical protein [Rubripirellula lacrimiformis]
MTVQLDRRVLAVFASRTGVKEEEEEEEEEEEKFEFKFEFEFEFKFFGVLIGTTQT